jgi:hypothetical protein
VVGCVGHTPKCDVNGRGRAHLMRKGAPHEEGPITHY